MLEWLCLEIILKPSQRNLVLTNPTRNKIPIEKPWWRSSFVTIEKLKDKILDRLQPNNNRNNALHCRLHPREDAIFHVIWNRARHWKFSDSSGCSIYMFSTLFRFYLPLVAWTENRLIEKYFIIIRFIFIWYTTKMYSIRNAWNEKSEEANSISNQYCEIEDLKECTVLIRSFLFHFRIICSLSCKNISCD